MAAIRFETGIKEFDLNGAVTVRFAPTDMTFIGKVYAALENMDKRQESYRAELESLSDAQIFDLARRIDAEAREEINSIFGTDVCTPLFGEMSLYTQADGFPLWANLLMAIIEQFEGAFAEEQKKTNPRLSKYTAKYAKR